MKRFEFHGKGLALRSTIVVVCEDLQTAWRLAKEWAAENVVDPSTLRLHSEDYARLPSVLYGWNGDY